MARIDCVNYHLSGCVALITSSCNENCAFFKTEAQNDAQMERVNARLRRLGWPYVYKKKGKRWERSADVEF